MLVLEPFIKSRLHSLIHCRDIVLIEQHQHIDDLTPIAAEQDFLQSLVDSGMLSSHDMDHVISLSEESAEPLDQILAKLGLLTEKEFAKAWAHRLDFEFDPEVSLSEELGELAALNLDYCRTERVLPINKVGEKYIVALVDPAHASTLSGLAFALEADIIPVLTTATQWDSLYSQFTHVATSPSDADDPSLDLSADADRLKDMASEEPIVRLVSRLVAQASNARASDIHLEPKARESVVKFRIDGVLHDHERLGRTQSLSVISRIKILAQLDIAERRRPQDGRFSFPVAGQPVDLRVSTIPTEHGESVVIRLLDQSSVTLSFDALGFSEESQAALYRLIKKPNGIVLVTGPTGSGKTTTLYTMLDQLSDGKRKILTIEDPIEQRLEGVSQTQTNPAIDFTFAAALKSFLRHDPDVIMVGEIRDLETARMAVQASLTGHLVFSTLHTNDAASSITRLIDMGIEDYLIASTLNGVVAQRLVRRLCSACHDKPSTKTTCGRCKGSGYEGRLVVAEILEMNDQFRSALRNGWMPSQVASVLNASGFVSMESDGFMKAHGGLTSEREISAAVGAHAR